MEEVSARAGLASSAAFDGGLATTISRSEVEEALRMEEPPDLVLDVAQISEGKPEETRKVAITWTTEDLERLLRDTAGETITLTFDRETLWQALDSDVEAHGMREKVVVLAIAAATAAGVGAGAASASLDEAGGFSGTSSTLVAPDDRADRNVVPAAETGVAAPDDRADRLVPTTGFEAPSVLPDDRAVRTVPPADQPSVVPDDRAVRTVTPADQPSVLPDDRAVRTVTPVDTPSVLPDDRAVRTVTPQPAPVQADDGFAIETPSPEAVAGIAGAIALAITGAAFIARTRRAPGQPA